MDLFGFPIVFVDSFGDEFDKLAPGCRPTGPITISGQWDDGRETCAVCHELFVPGPEGLAFLTCEQTGERCGPVCPACGAAVVAPGT